MAGLVCSQYTFSGECDILASKICTVAPPGSIVVSNTIVETAMAASSGFGFTEMKSLKLDQDDISLHSLASF